MNKDQPAQSTEAVIGPYELQDFNNFYATRFGYLPSKIAFLAWHAWRDKEIGSWPDVPLHKRRSYNLREIKRWLKVYLYRFSRPASSSVPASLTALRWDPEGRCRPVETTGHPATARRPPG